jgi:hypothetical protein
LIIKSLTAERLDVWTDDYGHDPAPKIKSLMKNIATEDAVQELGQSDGDASQDEIPSGTADLDVAVRFLQKKEG